MIKCALQTNTIQIKHNKLRIPTGGRLSSWLFTRRGGVDFGDTEDYSIQWQGGRFEPGTSGLQIQRPTTSQRSPPRLQGCRLNWGTRSDKYDSRNDSKVFAWLASYAIRRHLFEFVTRLASYADFLKARHAVLPHAGEKRVTSSKKVCVGDYHTIRSYRPA